MTPAGRGLHGHAALTVVTLLAAPAAGHILATDLEQRSHSPAHRQTTRGTGLISGGLDPRTQADRRAHCDGFRSLPATSHNAPTTTRRHDPHVKNCLIYGGMQLSNRDVVSSLSTQRTTNRHIYMKSRKSHPPQRATSALRHRHYQHNNNSSSINQRLE